jgi:uncharacterized repeat protein (TIGR01451 family)
VQFCYNEKQARSQEAQIAMRVKFLVVLVAVLALGLISTSGVQGQKGPANPIGPMAAPGELLVRFKSEASKAAINTVHAALGARVLRTFQIVSNLQLVQVNVSPAEARALYEKDPNVLYAEPNYVYHIAQQAALTPDDEFFSELWALENTGQTGGTPDADIDAPEAWELSTGSSDVVVAIIDSGVDYNHPDLMDNIWRNISECDGIAGVDDDHNGFVDDCYGVDMFNNDSDPLDDHGHGTHVAGIIGAKGNNSVGVVGVNWDVQIMACKFLSSSGSGFTSDAILCLEYVKLMKDRGVNIVATNNSWGGGGFSQALYDAIAAHMDAGILFIAAAGNSGGNNDTGNLYPASYYLPNVIAVAATDHNDDLPSFSNFGLHTVHVGAPGKSILSTMRDSTYSTLSGTSMATPHVTGLAALLKAHNPSLDWIALRNLILSSGDPKSSLDGKTISGRRINAYQALTSCTNAPLFAVLRPIQTLLGGAAMTISVLNINCASPAGPLSVTINPLGTTITLEDNGIAPDLAANDGIYSGIWVEPCALGNTFTLDFSNGESLTVETGGSVGIYSCTTPPMSWRTITGTNLNLSDDSSARITSPFPIKFGTASYSAIYVGANGAISFHQANFPFTNSALPNSSFTTLIAPFWDDLYPLARSKNNVFWTVRGSAPNRELVIEWRNVWHFNCLGDASGTVRFQVVFFERRTEVLFNYQDVSLGGECAAEDRGGSATIGIQTSETDATQIGFNWPMLNDNLAIVWDTARMADLAIVKSAQLDPIPVDSDITYTITITNNGPHGATNVRVTDTLPEEVTFVSADPSGACSQAGDTVTCSLGALVEGANATVTIIVRATTEGTLTNTVTVEADELDPNPENNGYIATTEVVAGVTCFGVVASSIPKLTEYKPTATRPSKKAIRITIKNNSEAARTVLSIKPLPGEPFTIERIYPSVPREIKRGRVQIFTIVTQREAGLSAATAIAPYFEIGFDCGRVASASTQLVPLHVEGLQTTVRAGQLHMEAQGMGIASLRLQLFDLRGHLLIDRTGPGNAVTIPLVTDRGKQLANGVYLSLVTVQGFDGRVLRTGIQKIVIIR